MLFIDKHAARQAVPVDVGGFLVRHQLLASTGVAVAVVGVVLFLFLQQFTVGAAFVVGGVFLSRFATGRISGFEVAVNEATAAVGSLYSDACEKQDALYRSGRAQDEANRLRAELDREIRDAHQRFAGELHRAVSEMRRQADDAMREIKRARQASETHDHRTFDGESERHAH